MKIPRKRHEWHNYAAGCISIWKCNIKLKCDYFCEHYLHNTIHFYWKESLKLISNFVCDECTRFYIRDWYQDIEHKSARIKIPHTHYKTLREIFYSTSNYRSFFFFPYHFFLIIRMEIFWWEKSEYFILLFFRANHQSILPTSTEKLSCFPRELCKNEIIFLRLSFISRRAPMRRNFLV